VLEEDRVHPVLQRASVLDEVQPETRSLALGAHPRAGQPHLRHEAAPGELGQHPAVDPVGLAGKRRQPTRLDGIGDPHVPAAQLELVVHEAGAAHRLDHRQHGRIAQLSAELRQCLTVRRDRSVARELPMLVEGKPVETLAAEIQSDIQHGGASLRCETTTRGASLRGRPSFIGFLTMEGPWGHARASAIIADTDSPANAPDLRLKATSRDVARVVSDVSVLCPAAVDRLDNRT
jgi:hypothetical protein